MYGVEFHVDEQHRFALIQEWLSNHSCSHLLQKTIQIVTGFGRTMIPNILAIPRQNIFLKMELIIGKHHQNYHYAI